jgi:hypothetical protein
MIKNMFIGATQRIWLTAVILLTTAIIAGLGLAWSGVWGSWGEPVAWAIGLAIQAILIIKGFQFLQGEQKRMEKRSFEVTLGLRKGYAPDAPVFAGEEVIAVIKRWADIRLAAKLPILTGKYVYGEGVGLLYPLRNDPANPLAGQFTIDEPLFVYTGELSPRYDAHRSDMEVLLTLRDLALYVGRTFGQKRMYYAFNGMQYAEDVR